MSELFINEQIRDPQVRLIGADGAQLGVVSLDEAMKAAQASDMDLVKIQPNAEPPVCKIMDYGKYRFDQMKKEKEAKKNQKISEVKEVRLSPNIDDHDVETKAKAAIKFLEHGDKVKASVKFRGREMTHQDLGMDVLNKFVELIGDAGTIDKPAKLEGRFLIVVLNPKSKK